MLFVQFRDCLLHPNFKFLAIEEIIIETPVRNVDMKNPRKKIPCSNLANKKIQ